MNEQLINATAGIVSTQLAAQPCSASEVPALINSVYDALSRLGQIPATPAPEEKPEPAVSARKSLANPNHILSMIDGKPYTMLKRHLAQNGMTPEQYRERYDLPADYPMTAKAYSERRRELAHSFGLGKKKDPAAPTKS